MFVINDLKGNNWRVRSKCWTCKNDFIGGNVFDVIVSRSVKFKVINHQRFVSNFIWLYKYGYKIGQFIIVNAVENDAVIYIVFECSNRGIFPEIMKEIIVIPDDVTRFVIYSFFFSANPDFYCLCEA